MESGSERLCDIYGYAAHLPVRTVPPPSLVGCRRQVSAHCEPLRPLVRRGLERCAGTTALRASFLPQPKPVKILSGCDRS